MIRKISVLLLILAMLLGLQTAAFAGWLGDYTGGSAWEAAADKAASDYFGDVAGEWGWAAGSVDLLYEKGVISGGERFAPGEAITRGDFMLMMLRALEIDTESGFSGEPVFSDVPADSIYAPAAEAGWELGIVNGSGGAFRPYDSISRQDAFTLIHRAALAVGAKELNFGGSLTMFEDGVRVADYAREAVANLVREGMVRGSSGLLLPLDNIARGEAAALVCRLMSMELTGGEHLSDAVLGYAGLDSSHGTALTELMTRDARTELGIGYLTVRPFYVERTGENSLRLMGTVYAGGAYWCTVDADVEQAEAGFSVVESAYSFG